MSIREHGGAVRYWRNKVTGGRACLCQDGTILLLVSGKWGYIANDLKPVAPDWEDDTSQSVSAAITRTTREALRKRTD